MEKILILLVITFFAACGMRVTTPIVSPEGESKGSESVNSSGQEEKGNVSDNRNSQGAPSSKSRTTDNLASVDDYRIGPGDILHLSVYKNEELTLDMMVRPDGKISLPLIQDVKASGLTAEELRDIIETRLKEFLVEPAVTVTVKEVNYPKFFIMGEIKKPGTYPLREKLTVLQAISLAGGFTDFASPRNIRLIRNNGTNTQNRRIDYHEMIQSGGDDKNPVLKPGDTIIIP